MCRKLMYLILSVVVLSLVGNVFAQEPAWDFYIPYAFEPPVLDAEVDAVWRGASTQQIAVPINGTADSALDASGHWQAMWDSQYIYLIVEILDSQLANDSANSYLDDSIEFYFDGGNTKKEYAVAGALSGDNRQYTFGWTADAIQGTNTNTTGVEHAQVNTPTGWRHEMRFPWMSLQGKAPQVGDLIGIDCFFNDDDDGGDTRETQLATFADDGGDWRNPVDWGTAILVLGESNIAYGSSPANGTVNPTTWVELSWKPGPTAVSHDVYIGDNFDDVNSGAAQTFRGNQALTNLYVGLGLPGDPYPGGLVPGTTYYWRIDEVNTTDPNSPWKGSIWSFSIPPRTAYGPNPADAAESVALNARLTWTAGFGAKLHTVYFGENFDSVSSAVSGGALVGTTAYSPTSMKAGKVYYWRVDETDPPNVHKGQVWSFTTLGAVGNPHPSNGNPSAEMNAILSWTRSASAASHQVYFGTDKVAVRNAGTTSPEYKGTRALGTESYDPGLLARDSTYYWRVDEVNNFNPNSPWKGPVWSFTTGPYLLVDDFEAYNDIDPPDPRSNTIFASWKDGAGTPTNGALVGYDPPQSYTERIIVHSGAQSMPYSYNNNLKYSEATMTLTGVARDWTREGIANLSLWFRGATTNAADRMYVALNGTAVVYHDNPSATQRGGWTPWIIPLQTFADLGVKLTDVSSIAIGFGTRGNTTTAGGTGKMYIDDIRLYRPTTP